MDFKALVDQINVINWLTAGGYVIQEAIDILKEVETGTPLHIALENAIMHRKANAS